MEAPQDGRREGRKREHRRRRAEASQEETGKEMDETGSEKAAKISKRDGKVKKKKKAAVDKFLCPVAGCGFRPRLRCRLLMYAHYGTEHWRAAVMEQYGAGYACLDCGLEFPSEDRAVAHYSTVHRAVEDEGRLHRR
jgi:hypothetical protein